MVRRSLIALALLGLAACDLPTDTPHWDQLWVVPVDGIRVNAVELLPSTVSVNADSTVFITETPQASIQLSLAQLCPECGVQDGLKTSKPEFSHTVTTNTTLPAELVSAKLAGGSFQATMEHSFNFDPLRPSADPGAPRGYLVVRVTSNGSVVAYDSISGNDVAFPGGTPLSPNLQIQPVDVSSSLDMEVFVYSPQGDSVTIQASDTAGVTLSPSTVEISEVTIDGTTISIDPVNTSMDFGDLDSVALERIQSGALLLDVSNPFPVTGTLDLTFQGLAPQIHRTLPLQQGSYQERLEFSADEIRSIIQAGTVDVWATGTVGSDGDITLTPDQELSVDSELELVVLVGSTGGV